MDRFHRFHRFRLRRLGFAGQGFIFLCIKKKTIDYNRFPKW